MEPNVRLSFQVSIAVPYATLIKAEWHSDFEHKDLICQNTKYWTRVSWAQKWHRGIVKCLTNCLFGCHSSHLGEGRLCPVMVGLCCQTQIQKSDRYACKYNYSVIWNTNCASEGRSVVQSWWNFWPAGQWSGARDGLDQWKRLSAGHKSQCNALQCRR